MGKGDTDKVGLFGNILRKADLYGQTPKFLFNGELACKTRYGGIISLFVIVAYLLCTVFTIWRYFDKSSVTTNYNEVYVHDPEGFQVTKESFPFAFGLEDSTTTNFVDEQIYTAKAFYKVYKKTTNGSTVSVDRQVYPLNVINCSLANLPKEYFTNVDLSNMYCLEQFIKPNMTLQLTGNFDSDTWAFIDIRFYRCNSTSCKSAADIEKKLGRGYFSMNYVDRTIRSTDYYNPVGAFPKNYYTPTSHSFSKTGCLWFQDTELYTENSLIGYMPPDLLKFSKPSRFEIDLLQISTTAPISNFFSIQLRVDTMKTQVNRSYRMIYQYLAEFGGLIQVVAVVAFFLTYRLAKTHLTIDLLKSSLVQGNPLEVLERSPNGGVQLRAMAANDSLENQGTKTMATTILSKKKGSKDNQIILKESESPEAKPNTVSPAFRSKKFLQKPKMVKLKKPNFVTVQEANMEVSKSSHIHQEKQLSIRKDSESGNFGIELEKQVQLESHKNDTGSPSSPNFWCKKGTPNPMMEGDDQLQAFETNKTDGEDIIESFDAQARLKEAVSKLTTLQVFCYSFWPFGKRANHMEEIMNYTQSNVESKLDMARMIKSMNDLQKFLYLALTSEQRLLFDLIPLSALENEGGNSIAGNPNETLDPRLKPGSYESQILTLSQAKAALSVLCESSDDSQISKKLMKHLDFIKTLDLK